MSNMQQYLLFILANLVSLQLCGSSGIVSVDLSIYDNSKGKEENGKCCDTEVNFLCHTNPCDHFFTVCLDYSNGSQSDIKQCRINNYTTGTTRDTNFITFRKSIGETLNPKELTFHSWPGHILLKVRVMDADTHSNADFVEHLYNRLNMKASRSRVEKIWKKFQVKKQTRLEIKLAVFCDENWYSPKCDVYCKPTKNCRCTSGGKRHCECRELGKWGSDCDKSCYCQNGRACNFMTGKCPNDECARGWGGSTCNQADMFISAHMNFTCQGTIDTSVHSPAFKLMDDDLNTCESIETSSTNSQLNMHINKVLRVPVVTITSNLTCSPFDGIFVMVFTKCLEDASCNGYACVPQVAEPVILPDGNRLFSCKFYCDDTTGFMFVHRFVVGAVDNAALVCEIQNVY